MFDLSGKPDEDEDGLPDEFEVSGLVISTGKVIYTDPEIRDCDGDGLLDGEEVYIDPSKSKIVTKTDKRGSHTEYTTVVFEYKSDPWEKDTDGDGIDDYDETNGVTYNSPNGTTKTYDGDPLNKGLKDEIVGKLTIVSHDPTGLGFSSVGHSFLLYESFINDTLDFSNLAGGFKYHELNGCTKDADNWQPIKPGTYKISPNRYICIGNFSYDGIAGGDSSGASGSGSGSDNSSSGEISTAGVHFNLELNLLYDDNDNNGSYDRGYSNNLALDQVITDDQLETIIDYWNDDQFYNIVHNNCAEIATKTWNKVSDYELDGFDIMYSPRKLKKSIEENDSSYSINWRSDSWKNTLNQEVIEW